MGMHSAVTLVHPPVMAQVAPVSGDITATRGLAKESLSLAMHAKGDVTFRII